MNRRIFIKLTSLFLGVIISVFYILEKIFNLEQMFYFKIKSSPKIDNSQNCIKFFKESIKNDKINCSYIYESKNGTPEQNMAAVLEQLGGIEKIVGPEDIVIIKPNGQQIEHLMTNTNTIKELIDQIISITSFKGEVIIAENHHFQQDNCAGWTTKYPNGDFNLNQLIEYFTEKGVRNVSKYHWRDGGLLINHPLNSNETGKIVTGPDEGDGYFWTNEVYSYNGRQAKLTYPIFTSEYSGITIDFKNGAWKNSNYTGQPVKFINISSLRNHSNAGVSASIKNYFGIVDLSCGFRGQKPSGYYNFHYIAVDWPKVGFLRNGMQSFITSKLAKTQKYLKKIANYVGPQNGALGGAVGYFMKKIRMADLNIITAEYVGYESRRNKPAHTKTVLASTDPVALDYYASKYVLFPLRGTRAEHNNPDNPRGTLYKYLKLCNEQEIGTLNESEMILHSFDFSSNKT